MRPPGLQNRRRAVSRQGRGVRYGYRCGTGCGAIAGGYVTDVDGGGTGWIGYTVGRGYGDGLWMLGNWFVPSEGFRYGRYGC